MCFRGLKGITEFLILSRKENLPVSLLGSLVMLSLWPKIKWRKSEELFRTFSCYIYYSLNVS